MRYRLLVDLQSFRVQIRRRLMARFKQILQTPDRLALYQGRDPSGRTCDVKVLAGLAIYYWTDFFDQHVKIPALVPTEGR